MCAFDNPSNYLWAVLALSGANGQPDGENSELECLWKVWCSVPHERLKLRPFFTVHKFFVSCELKLSALSSCSKEQFRFQLLLLIWRDMIEAKETE